MRGHSCHRDVDNQDQNTVEELFESNLDLKLQFALSESERDRFVGIFKG